MRCDLGDATGRRCSPRHALARVPATWSACQLLTLTLTRCGAVRYVAAAWTGTEHPRTERRRRCERGRTGGRGGVGWLCDAGAGCWCWYCKSCTMPHCRIRELGRRRTFEQRRLPNQRRLGGAERTERRLNDFNRSIERNKNKQSRCERGRVAARQVG